MNLLSHSLFFSIPSWWSSGELRWWSWSSSVGGCAGSAALRPRCQRDREV